MTLTPALLADLRQKALAATPGPRRVAKVQQVGRSRRFTVPDRAEDELIVSHHPGVGVVLVKHQGGQMPSADANFAAAASPDVVLALLDATEAQPEVCVCAAVKLADGYIVRGHRHDDCLVTAGKREHARAAHAGEIARPVGVGSVQGFMTTRNRFVDRFEGARLQDAAGIVSVDDGFPIGRMLFSEDLY